MLIDVDKTLDCTVTVYNRANAKDVGDKADRYVRKVMFPCNWQEAVTRSVDASGTVIINPSIKVQIPASTADYLPYAEWLGSMDDHFTASTGDYWALGEAPEAETKAEVLAAVKGLPHFETKGVRDLRNNNGVSAAASGALKYASIILVEGV